MRVRNFFTWTMALLVSFGLAAEAATSQELSFGDVVEAAPDVRMVVGREIDLKKNEIDIANALLYKSDTTLVVIDTGGTSGFVQYLDTAAKQLMPFDKVVLISTHGHADHVGNNAWIDTLDVPATHYISSRDLVMMRDQVGYFETFLGNGFAQGIVDMFGGLDTETKNLRVLESLPLKTFTIGGTAWDGWSLLDGEVLVLRTSGHTAGHVVAFLRTPKLMHLGDESTSFYQAFSDGTAAGPAFNLLTLQRAANAAESGSVEIITDGHSFAVHHGDEAVGFLNGLIDGAVAYDAAVTRILGENPGGISISELIAQIGEAPEMADVAGAKNPYVFLQISNKLKELGVLKPVNPTAGLAFPK
jgi:glyoxylase-like metal-dependent hydrolase (beta-lactamase superfamily II)